MIFSRALTCFGLQVLVLLRMVLRAKKGNYSICFDKFVAYAISFSLALLCFDECFFPIFDLLSICVALFCAFMD